MTPQDIQAAAERWSKCEHTGNDLYDLAEYGVAALNRAVLATVPQDDAEPVTGEWLASIGCKPHHWKSGTTDWDVPSDEFRIEVRVWHPDGIMPDMIISNSREIGNIQVQVPTRGQVRRLLAALGLSVPGRDTQE